MEIVNVNMKNSTGVLEIIRSSLLLLKLFWIILMLLSLSVNLTSPLITCGPGIISKGGTYPSGDIILEYGSGVPLEITCILDIENNILQNIIRQSVDGSFSKQPSQKIIFHKNFEPISGQYVSIINSTTAQMRLVNPPVGQDIYYCALLLHNQQRKNHSNDTTNVTRELSTLKTNGVFPPTRVFSHTYQESIVEVCLNRVFVGYKPFQITNFSCTSYNWENLICNWIKPLNPVKTTYQISFQLPGRPGGRVVAECPTDSDIVNNTCYWDISTSPMYRQPYEYYFFTLHGKNALGNSSTSIIFHHYANVIPSKPFNIIATDTTQSSVMLMWSIGSMAHFPQELIYKIEYISRRNSTTERWRSVKFTSRPDCNSSSAIDQITSYFQKRSKCYIGFNVTDLRYPFTDYDFHIYVRTSSARGEDKWSAPGSITVKTKPTIPKNPPLIDIGSFESVPSKVDQYKRDVLIYWQDIDDDEKCGDSFQYLAYYTSTTSDNKIIIHRSDKTYENYAIFNGLSTSVGYSFTVYSSNSEGLSTGFSTVYVPSESQKLHKPLAVTLMTFDEYGVYEMSWENADNRTSSANNESNYYYTLFWCEKSNNFLNQCNGQMNWIRVPSFISWYNITGLDYEKNYRFAISSNSLTNNKRNQFVSTSSGMTRESCRALYGKSIENTMDVRVSVMGTHFMALKWSFNCTERIGFVDGYHINYCPSNPKNSSDCNGTMSTKTINKDILQKEACIAILTNLKPLTTYMITVSVITYHGKGLIYSETIFKTTLGRNITQKYENNTKNYEVKYF